MKVKPTRQYIKSEENKKKIYDVAIALFKEYGYDNTSMQEISRKSGFTIGSIYNYYGNKTGFIRRLCTETAQDCFSLIAVTEEHIADPIHAISMLFSEMAFSLENNFTKDIGRHFRDVREENDYLSVGFHMWGELYQKLVYFIQEGQRLGNIRIDSPASEITEYALSMFEGCITNWIWNQIGMKDSFSAETKKYMLLALNYYRT